jgi:dihydrofolate reductase
MASAPSTPDSRIQKRIALVVAADLNDGIGYRGGLPWHLPGDLKFFKRVTQGHPLVMGRKTHETIGRALPGRANIVISRNPNFRPFDGACRANSLISALAMASHASERDTIMVIGGEGVFRQALPLASTLYLTRVRGEFPADTYLPRIDWDDWRKVWREEWPPDAQNEVGYSFMLYERRDKAA